DRAVGSITACIPLTNLESVKQKLMTTFQREQSDEDISLKRILTENIKSVSVDFRAELGRTILPAGDILSLDVGDIIQLDKRKDEMLPAFVGGIRKYMGSPGIHRGNKAFLIKRKVFDRERD
ncbi:MAG: FliM/FliN family flagellar motor switch protein, partial [Proteobacteria bacterium]|nr:FliM/FliN family flagellar motor switch protein [Pseudomonadota bacterium]